tara:strand:+ start:350 stop:616 length:267 start_codon:yes stop_codon:yes gene_type:complete
MGDQYEQAKKVRDAIEAKRKAEQTLELTRMDYERTLSEEDKIRKEGGQEAVDKHYSDERRSDFYDDCMTGLKVVGFCLAFYFLLIHQY